MRMLTVAFALATATTLAASFALPVHATPTPGLGSLSLPSSGITAEPAACRGGGEHCPPGYHWVCGPNRCWCAPC